MYLRKCAWVAALCLFFFSKPSFSQDVDSFLPNALERYSEFKQAVPEIRFDEELTDPNDVPKEISAQAYLSFWNLIADNGEIAGEEMLGNYDCFILDAEDADAGYSFWVEKETLNIIQVEEISSQGHIRIWWNSDFRAVPDTSWQVPFKIEVYEDSRLIATVRVKSARKS